jgi:hypothetical protein
VRYRPHVLLRLVEFCPQRFITASGFVRTKASFVSWYLITVETVLVLVSRAWFTEMVRKITAFMRGYRLA